MEIAWNAQTFCVHRCEADGGARAVLFSGGGKKPEGFLGMNFDVVSAEIAKCEKSLRDAATRFCLTVHFVKVCGHKVFSVWGVDAVGGFEEGLYVGGHGFQARQGVLDWGAQGA